LPSLPSVSLLHDACCDWPVVPPALPWHPRLLLPLQKLPPLEAGTGASCWPTSPASGCCCCRSPSTTMGATLSGLMLPSVAWPSSMRFENETERRMAAPGGGPLLLPRAHCIDAPGLGAGSARVPCAVRILAQKKF